MTEEEAHEYFLNEYKYKPALGKSYANTVFDIEIGEPAYITTGNHEGTLAVVSGLWNRVASNSLYHNDNRYKLMTLGNKSDIGVYCEYQLCRARPYDYEVGEIAVACNEFSKLPKVINQLPVEYGVMFKVEIVDYSIDLHQPHQKLYTVRRPGRKKTYVCNAYNLRKLRTVQPFEETDLSDLLISPEILLE